VNSQRNSNFEKEIIEKSNMENVGVEKFMTEHVHGWLRGKFMKVQLLRNFFGPKPTETKNKFSSSSCHRFLPWKQFYYKNENISTDEFSDGSFDVFI
jgi:hypothetical protein